MLFGFGNKSEGNNISGKKIVIVKHRCPKNHPCPSVRVCPVGALSQVGYGAPTVDHDKCVRCGKCVRYCPMGAITTE